MYLVEEAQTMRFLLLAVAGLLALGRAAAAQANQDIDTDRLNREAKALFVVVIRAVGIPKQSCVLDSAWSTRPIPFVIAHRFLGVQAFADLQSPPSIAPPSAVIGGVPNEAWCSDEQWTQFETAHSAAQVAALRALPRGADPEPLWWRRGAFSFPIFGKAYDRAVVVHENVRWPVYVVGEKGIVMRAPPEGGGSAYVYKRKGGVWSKLDEEELFSVD